jgi:hypothetical protein
VALPVPVLVKWEMTDLTNDATLLLVVEAVSGVINIDKKQHEAQFQPNKTDEYKTYQK